MNDRFLWLMAYKTTQIKPILISYDYEGILVSLIHNNPMYPEAITDQFLAGTPIKNSLAQI